jgi:hypothetical protein
MSFEALIRELANLDSKERQKIISYLVEMNHRDNPQHRAELTRKISDNDPSHWLTLEEFDRRLSLREDERPE